MGTTDDRMKALDISNKRPYIERRERYRIFSESKKSGGDEINDQHKTSFNKIPVVITQFTTTS